MAKYKATVGLLFHGKWTDLATGETHLKRAIPAGTEFETDVPLEGRHKTLAKPLTKGYQAPDDLTPPAELEKAISGNGAKPKKGGK